MTDNANGFTCQGCGAILPSATTHHTYEDCERVSGITALKEENARLRAEAKRRAPVIEAVTAFAEARRILLGTPIKQRRAALFDAEHRARHALLNTAVAAALAEEDHG